MCNNPIFFINPRKVTYGIYLSNLKLSFKRNMYSNRKMTVAPYLHSDFYFSWTSFRKAYVSDKGFLTAKGLEFAYSHGFSDFVIELPCGKCLGCALDRANQWTARCMLEAMCHDENYFITLTYNDDHVPVNSDGYLTLFYRDFQLFIKRLRKAHPDENIRYRVCCEYGSRTRRPHYHALLFGLKLRDLQPFKKVSGRQHYISNHLQRLWSISRFDDEQHKTVYNPIGFVDVAPVEVGSIRYVSNYMLKHDCLFPDVETAKKELKEFSGVQSKCYPANIVLGKIERPAHRQSSRPSLGSEKLLTESTIQYYLTYDHLPPGFKLPVKRLRWLDNVLKECDPIAWCARVAQRRSIALASVPDDVLTPFERRRRREETLRARAQLKVRD